VIITRSPNRCTLFGSSTDLKEWSSIHGGISINFAINKYSYITLKSLPKFFDYKTKVSYSEIECVKNHEDIKHNVIRNALLMMDIHDGLDIVHMSDLFSKCGLGSSSSFSVALLQALSIWKGEYWNKTKLASEAYRLEHDICKENIGTQDQLASCTGGLNRFDYYPNGDITTTPIFLSRNFLNYFQECCLLLFTGIHRSAHQITSKYVPSLLEKEREQKRMIEIAYEGHKALLDGQIEKVGKLLNETWEEKRKISDIISTPEIDYWYDTAKQHAWGFKLLGAGGGGSILILADPSQHATIKSKLNLVEIPFKIDWNGSKILYVNQDGLCS
jgi:D-glycero-alpha-D-manno-heptose-7-phosphate kinase